MTVEELEQGISNPGELLRRERERVGFTAEEVAAHLHLSKTTLGYLEAGRFDRLPGDTFTRGYIRSYARLLKLDPGTLARHYDRYTGSEGRDTRVTSINRIETPRRTGRLIMGVSTLVIVAGMLALGLWWWSDSREASLPADSNTVQDLLEDVQVDSMVLPESFREQVDNEADDSSQLQSEDAPAQITEQEQSADQTAAEPVAAAAPAGVPAEPVTAEPETSAAAPQPAEQSAAASGNGLVITFSANCWVQVTVPGGRILHSGQMGPGQTLNIDQSGPLDLVIGAADAVSTIEYKGQPVQLNANRQSGVARLRLGQ